MRKKGRDLFDLFVALKQEALQIDDIIRCYRKYIEFTSSQPPTYKQFVNNMELKLQDSDFISDSDILLRPGITFDPALSYDFVKSVLIDKLKTEKD